MFALVHNNKIVVGPRSWNFSFFNEYLVENQLDATSLTRPQPTQAIITDDWKILPVSITQPSYDPILEQLAGPFWTIGETEITGVYNVVPQSLDTAKSKLKEAVTNNRYIVETTDIPYTFPDNQTVEIYASREERGIYLETMLVLPAEMSIMFKFKGNTFKQVTKADLQAIVDVGMMHIQSAFAWESTKFDEIDAATSLQDLVGFEVRHPSQIPTVE